MGMVGVLHTLSADAPPIKEPIRNPTVVGREGQRYTFLITRSSKEPRLVEPRGIEPLTFALRTRRSPS